MVLILNLPAVVEHVASSRPQEIGQANSGLLLTHTDRMRLAWRREEARHEKVRVLVVDDSALMRKLIPQMLAADESIEVVGTAMDGSFCLKKIEELKPTWSRWIWKCPA